MQRKLASVQKITDIKPIEGADKIAVATVLGWQVVILKEDFKVDDLVIYFETDSLLPIHPAFEFLAKDGTKTILGDDKKDHTGYRLRTIKLRGQVSQGLCVKPEEFGLTNVKEGDDVTERLGVVKYERFIEPKYMQSNRKPVVFPKWMPRKIGMWIKGTFPNLAVRLWGKMLKPFPPFIPKTDEMRLQAVPDVLKRHKDKVFYVTEKLDGSSVTVFKKDGEVGVCSRNIWYPRDEDNQYWKPVIESGLDKVIDDGIAMQGELIGESVQDNRLRQKGQKIYFFNVYDLKRNQYLSLSGLVCFCLKYGVEMVPLLSEKFKLRSMNKMVEYATRKSVLNKDAWAEGVVFRPLEEAHDEELGRLSFKVINPTYLLEHKI